MFQIQTEDDLLPLLSLDTNPDPNPKKFHVPASTIILSRVCVNFLSSRASFSDWAVCRAHRDKLLDLWVPGEGCCHHRCTLPDTGDMVMGRVTYSMSKTILKSEGKMENAMRLSWLLGTLCSLIRCLLRWSSSSNWAPHR